MTQITSFLAKKRLKIAFLTTFVGFLSFSSASQIKEDNNEIQSILHTLIEDYTEFNERSEEFDFNLLYEELFRIYQTKLDLNKSDPSDFQGLFFLSDADVQKIISYRADYGDFLSIYELQSVPGLSIEKLSMLSLFVEIRSSKVPDSDLTLSGLNQSRSQLYLKWKYNIETARGFKSINNKPPKYIGDKQHLYLRFNHTKARNRVGLIIEKDPGESLSNKTSYTGLDYLSVYYQIDKPTTWIKKINIGDYSINLGQGLTTHAAFGLGKSSMATHIKKGQSGVRIYNSVSENIAFRGIALTIQPRLSKFSALAFGSYIPRDANISGMDSLGFTTFSSLPATGLHRTTGEREDQDATNETSIGASIKFNHSDVIQISLNTIHHQFDKRFEISNQPYQLFRWHGDKLTNISIDYNVHYGGWNIYGEIASSAYSNYQDNSNLNRRGWAQIHGIVKTFDPTFDISVVYRNYGRTYNTLYGNAFGERSSVNDEKGIYIGMEYRPARRWSIRAYADQWRHDWLKFRVDSPSSGHEYLFRIDYKENRSRHFYIQYRYETKDENSIKDLRVDVPVPKTIQRLRLHTAHQLLDGLELRSRIEFSLYHKEQSVENGILMYQDVISRKMDTPLSLSARIAYFNISNFDARIYTFENDLLFEYYIPSFNGEGIRYYLHCRYILSRKLMAEIRWEQTKYFDRESISSGNNLIEGSVTSRIKMQVRYQF